MTKVSLHPPCPEVSIDPHHLPPALAPEASVILGWKDNFTPISPAPDTLFGPRGVLLHSDGSLWVCDTGHHRVLGWKKIPLQDNTPADIVLGQKDFLQEGRNAKQSMALNTLNVPTGITEWGKGLAIADAWNHRILFWRNTPENDFQPADLVLGNTEPTSTRHPIDVSADSLYWPYGVYAQKGGRVFVADTGNRRVLVWDRVWKDHQEADRVLGQRDFSGRDENAGTSVGPMGMRWPHDIAVWKNCLLVADAGNNRVMMWSGLPRDATPCNTVLGQDKFFGCDHNRGNYFPDKGSLNMPYGIKEGGEFLWVNDTANSRILVWEDPDSRLPKYLLGQPDFHSKGDNQWKPASRSSLCWPYGISYRTSVGEDYLAVADSGNNRVMLWKVKRMGSEGVADKH